MLHAKTSRPSVSIPFNISIFMWMLLAWSISKAHQNTASLQTEQRNPIKTSSEVTDDNDDDIDARENSGSPHAKLLDR
jgi:hypothetical protein